MCVDIRRADFQSARRRSELHVIVGVSRPRAHGDLAAFDGGDQRGRIFIRAGFRRLDEQGIIGNFIRRDQIALGIVERIRTIGILCVWHNPAVIVGEIVVGQRMGRRIERDRKKVSFGRCAVVSAGRRGCFGARRRCGVTAGDDQQGKRKQGAGKPHKGSSSR